VLFVNEMFYKVTNYSTFRATACVDSQIVQHTVPTILLVFMLDETLRLRLSFVGKLKKVKFQ
jgi:hypothetical protein